MKDRHTEKRFKISLETVFCLSVINANKDLEDFVVLILLFLLSL